MNAESQREEVLSVLLASTASAAVLRDGGLIRNLTAYENIELPVLYHEVQGAGALLPAVFCKCGLINENDFELLLRKLPEQMSAYEKRLTGFLRAMRVEPDLMVYDGIYDGLSRREINLVAKFDEVFHLFFPFRTSVLINFERMHHTEGNHAQMIHLSDEHA